MFFSLMLLIFAIVNLFIVNTSLAGLCNNWSEGTKIGKLDPMIIPESSGIAASKRFANRLYHINDSGNDPYFYITDIQGNNIQSVRIKGFDASNPDFEDVSIGPCLNNKSCLFIGDIGDNEKSRETIQILVIKEMKDYPGSVIPFLTLTLVYPDRPHDAEGMAVHTNGDIFILTKEANYKKLQAYPAKLFKLKREKWEESNNKIQKLEPVGEIDFPYLAGSDSSLFGRIVSAFDIAPDGAKFLVLTYENAFEFQIDLVKSDLESSLELKNGKDYRIIKLKRLPWQEAITYLPGARSFIYDTEYREKNADIIKVECLN